MFEGKAIILGAVLKQEKPFKAAKVFALTELSRSLIRYHLDKFVEDGTLEKAGMYYSIVDRDALINSLADMSEGPTIQLVSSTLLLGKDADQLNNTIRAVAVFRILELPYYQEVKNNVIKEIDDTIKQLKNARKYINAKSMTQKRALNTLKELEVGPKIFHGIEVFGLAPLVGRTEFIEQWEQRMGELEQ